MNTFNEDGKKEVTELKSQLSKIQQEYQDSQNKLSTMHKKNLQLQTKLSISSQEMVNSNKNLDETKKEV